MALKNSTLPNVSFASEFNYERVALKGVALTTLGASQLTIPHGLGYTPYVLVYALWQGAYHMGTQSPYSHISVLFSADNTNLYLAAYANSEGSFGNSVSLAYRVYEERQNVS